MPLVTSCPTCGARIDAAPRGEAYVHPCRFCGTNIPIEPLVDPAAAQREAAARVTADAIARMAEARAREVEARARGGARRTRRNPNGCAIQLVALLLVGLPIGITFWPKLSSLAGARFGSFPIQVAANDSLEIDDRTASADDTLVTLGPNAKLTLRRCHLKGPLIVKAGVNSQITVVDSTLEGTKAIFDADETNAVITIQGSTLTSGESIVDDGAINLKVSASKDSKLSAQGVAFPAALNAEISIDHSTVDGKVGGIEVKSNGKVKLTDGAVLRSDGPAIDLGNNGRLTITSARVESKTTAVHAGSNLEGTLRSATVVGAKASLDVGINARVTVTASSLTGPRIVPKLSEVDER